MRVRFAKTRTRKAERQFSVRASQRNIQKLKALLRRKRRERISFAGCKPDPRDVFAHMAVGTQKKANLFRPYFIPPARYINSAHATIHTHARQWYYYSQPFDLFITRGSNIFVRARLVEKGNAHEREKLRNEDIAALGRVFFVPQIHRKKRNSNQHKSGRAHNGGICHQKKLHT